MIAFNRVLIPTDFTPLATHALRYAIDLVKAYRTELHILHVVSPAKDIPISTDGGGAVGAIGSGLTPMEPIEAVVARKHRELEEYVAEFSPPRLSLETKIAVRAGVPWREIVSYSEEAAIDLIVMGSHAKGVMRRILLGSTSKSVLEHVARPVLLVPIAALQGESRAQPTETVPP